MLTNVHHKEGDLKVKFHSSLESAFYEYFGFLGWKFEVIKISDLETYIHIDFDKFNGIGRLNWNELFYGVSAKVRYQGGKFWVVRLHWKRLSKSVGTMARLSAIDSFYRKYFEDVNRGFVDPCNCKDFLDFEGIKVCSKCKLILGCSSDNAFIKRKLD